MRSQPGHLGSDWSTNPWPDLPEQPEYVLDVDRRYLDAYNALLSDDDPRRINFTVPPEPFLGLHDAPVVVLSCNPAFSDGAVDQFTVPGFMDGALANLRTPGGAAIYPLEDRFSATPGGKWWRKRLKGLLAGGEDSFEQLARRILSVEFHGYWSPNWEAPLVTLPSQPYSFGLVEAAIQRNAIIILTRARRHWMQAVPDLIGYENLLTTNTQRSAVLSKGNLGEVGHQMVIEALQVGATYPVRTLEIFSHQHDPGAGSAGPRSQVSLSADGTLSTGPLVRGIVPPRNDGGQQERASGRGADSGTRHLRVCCRCS